MYQNMSEEVQSTASAEDGINSSRQDQLPTQEI